MNKSLKLFGILLFFASCKTETEQRVVGKWQAAQLMECDNLVPIQTELVDIEFSANGNYVFHSTLNIKEEGTYRIKKNYLFTQDKLREKAPEKAVLIKSLTADSMVLQMSYKGKDQYLTLIREGVSEKNREKEQEDSKAQALALAAGTGATAVGAAIAANPTDSIQKAEEEKKKQAEADKEAERKKEEAAADKKREAEADRKREEAKSKSKKSESSSSSSEAYKKREAKRKEEEKKAKVVAEKKAAAFRKEYAKREAEKEEKEVMIVENS